MSLFPEREELASVLRFPRRRGLQAAAEPLVPDKRERALVGASTEVRRMLTETGNPLRQYDSWQQEAWDYWDTLGEFRFGVSWLSKLISRVRLVAAEDTPENDEPERLDSGPSVDLIDAFGGGIGGQATLLSKLTVHLSIPGDSYLVQEDADRGPESLRLYSTDEIRSRAGRIEVIDTEKTLAKGSEIWRSLPVTADGSPNHLLVRIWRPHDRKYYLADSPARAALPTLRRLELINRKIQAELLSRIASNGVILFPNEVTLPNDPKYDDEDDPFMAEWIDLGSTGIANPGSASAVMPLPVRMPGEYVDKVKHITFATEMDRRILQERDAEIRELAATLDLPAEIMLGLGDANHWTAWQVDEAAIKVPVSSLMELICHALTVGYLQPLLKAQGVDPEGQVVWYDTSEITQRPDRSENAINLYDRFEITGEALRRETGMDESDRPGDDELREMIWKKAASNAQLTTTAVSELGLGEVAPPAGAPTDAGGAAPPNDANAEADGPPDTQGDQPPPPDDGVTPAAARAAAAFASVTHVMDVQRGGGFMLRHPGCQEGCPVTSAAHLVVALPGTPGQYECRMLGGRLVVLGRTHDANATLAAARFDVVERLVPANGQKVR